MNHCLFVTEWVPSGSNNRRKIAMRRVLKKWPALSEPLRSERERRQLIMLFGGNGGDLVTQADIHSQVPKCPPLVLHIAAYDYLPKADGCVRTRNGSGERGRLIGKK